MNLHCIGINHRTAPVDVREKMWFSNEETRAFLGSLRSAGTKECVLASTCNRTELYYVPQENVTGGGSLLDRLLSFKNAGGSVGEHHFYSLPSLHAAHHLFRLASGADSMVLGDVQILHQIKSAFSVAQETGSVGLILNRLFSNALHVGKRVRAETEIGDGAISVGYAAAELASKIFQDLSQKSALLIGAGETGELTATHLRAAGLGHLLIANRTRERAEALAKQLTGKVIDFDALREHIFEVDIIISSIHTPAYVLQAVDVQEAMKRRGNRPLFAIDLGVPRNIDPSVAKTNSVFLHDIDALNHIVDRNVERRRAAVPAVNRIVLKELTEFKRWHESLDLTPTIRELRKQFEEIRTAEFEQFRHRFSGDTQEEIAMLTKRIVNKILHTPMVQLKEAYAVSEHAQLELHLVRSLFGLDGRARH